MALLLLWLWGHLYPKIKLILEIDLSVLKHFPCFQSKSAVVLYSTAVILYVISLLKSNIQMQLGAAVTAGLDFPNFTNFRC